MVGKHNVVLQTPSLVGDFFHDYIVMNSYLYQATMKIVIQKRIVLANKNSAEWSYHIQTLHSKEIKNVQIFGAEDMYIDYIMAF